jgi:hypothetical protein
MEWKKVLAEIRHNRHDLFDGGGDNAKAQHVIDQSSVALPFAQQFGNDRIMGLAAALEVDDRVSPLLHLGDDTCSLVFEQMEQCVIGNVQSRLELPGLDVVDHHHDLEDRACLAPEYRICSGSQEHQVDDRFGATHFRGEGESQGSLKIVNG